MGTNTNIEGWQMHLRGYSSYTQAFIYYRNDKGGALPDKDQAALLRQLNS